MGLDLKLLPDKPKRHERTRRFEGGYTEDHAGPTNMGVTQNTYDSYLKRKKLPTKKVIDISEDEATEIYDYDFYEQPKINTLPENTGDVVFDYGVNAGPRTAIKGLQKVIDAKPDGIIGDETRSKANEYIKKHGEKDLLDNILKKREEHNKNLIEKNPTKYKRFERGWQNRINSLRKEFDISMLNPFKVKEAAASGIKLNLDILPDKPSRLNLDLLPDKPTEKTPLREAGEIVSESVKGALRGFEGFFAGIGAVTQWIGENITEGIPSKIAGTTGAIAPGLGLLPKKSPEWQKNIQEKIGNKIATWGKNAYSFWREESQRGIEAPDIETFRGGFMENPSWTRGVATVAEAIPSLAAATVVGVATGNVLAGAAALGIVEGSGQYVEARQAGKDVIPANVMGGLSVVGTTVLEVLPLTRFVKGGAGKLGKDIFLGAVQEGGEEVLQALWQNTIAKIGYEKTRDLTQGMIEGFIGGAGSGGVLGGFTSGRGAQMDSLIKEAIIKGVPPKNINAMQEAVKNQIVSNADEIDSGLEKAAVDESAQYEAWLKSRPAGRQELEVPLHPAPKVSIDMTEKPPVAPPIAPSKGGEITAEEAIKQGMSAEEWVDEVISFDVIKFSQKAITPDKAIDFIVSKTGLEVTENIAPEEKVIKRGDEAKVIDTAYGLGNKVSFSDGETVVNTYIKETKDQIILNTIDTKDVSDLTKIKKGTGKGTQVIDSLKEYADSTGKQFVVPSVTKTAKPFWEKIPYLKQKYAPIPFQGKMQNVGESYVYNPKESQLTDIWNKAQGKGEVEAELHNYMREMIEMGEPGKRIPVEGPEGKKWTGIPSSYPEWFKNKGYNRKDTLNIISKVQKGSVLTPKQQSIYDDLKQGAAQEFGKEEKYYAKQEKREREGLEREEIEKATRAGEAQAQSDIDEAIPDWVTERQEGEVDEYRKSILPEYNTNEDIIEVDALVDKIRKLDPKSEDDATLIKHGNKYEVTVSYPHSLGEMGNQTSFVYKENPTVEDIKKDILEKYKDFKKEVNEEMVMGIVAKSGRDENIEAAIDKVLKSEKPKAEDVLKVEPKTPTTKLKAKEAQIEHDRLLAGFKKKTDKQLEFEVTLDKERKGDILKEKEAAYGNEEKADEAIRRATEEASQTRSVGTKADIRAIPKKPSQVVQEMLQKGFAIFKGKTVSSAQDVAELFSLARNPYIEIFQAIAVKGGKIVAHKIVSSGHPSSITDVETTLQETLESAHNLKADSIYLGHNHPGGNPIPSREDNTIARDFARAAEVYGIKMAGHITTNGDNFYIADADGVSYREDYKTPKKNLARGILKQISNSQDIVSMLKNYDSGDNILVVLLTAQNGVISTEKINPNAKNYVAEISQILKDNIVSVYVVAGDSKLIDADKFKALPRGNLDVISIKPNGEYVSFADKGILPRQLSFTGVPRKTSYLAEKGKGYGDIIEPSEKSSKVKVAKTDYAKVGEEVPSREETNLIKEALKITSPARVSEATEKAGLILRKNIAELAHKDILAIEATKKAHSAFTWMSAEDSHKFIDNVETGEGQVNEKLQAFADTLRGLLDNRRTAIQNLGKGQLKSYYENYFPHIWKDPKNAKNVIMQIMGRKRLEGTKAFLKKRSIVTIKDGLRGGLSKEQLTEAYYLQYPEAKLSPKEGKGGGVGGAAAAAIGAEGISKVIETKRVGEKPAPKIPTLEQFITNKLSRGLELVSDNPVDLVLLKLHEMDRYIMSQNIIRGMKERGLAKFVYSRKKAPEGYSRINDNAFTVFMPPEITKKEAYDSIIVDQLMDIAKGLNIDTKRFVSIGGKRWGYAQWTPGMKEGEKIRTKYAGPESVLAHEIGHVIGVRYGVYDLLGRRKEGEMKVHKSGKKAGEEYFKPTKESVEYRREIDKQWRDLADARWKGVEASPGYKNYVRNSREKEAVLLEALIHAPKQFQKIAPDLYSGFTKFLNSNGELRPLLDVEPSLVLGESDAKIKVPGFTTLGHYYAPTDVARLINNHLSPGIRNADNKLVSGAYNILRGAGNILNQVNLSLSGFHAINVSTDMMASTLGLGLRKLGTKGQFLGGLKDIVSTPLAPIEGIWQGSRIKKAYRQQMESIEDPKLRTMVEAIVAAGGRDRMDVFYYNQQVKALTKTFRDILQGTDLEKLTGAVRLPFNVFGATVEVLAKPIMEWYVPTGKLGLFAKLAEHEMQRAESGEITDEQLWGRLASVWDSVDNRMGQLIYDNLFWNKTMKDGLMLAIRSVGWNLGSWREYAGAGVDLATFVSRAKKGDKFFSQKMAYVTGAAIVYSTLGAVITYILTGKPPEEPKDYFFPKTGRKNPDGTDERLSLPTYAKDIYAYSQRPLETVKNKAHPLIGLLSEEFHNKDFYNVQIANPQDWVFDQILDRGKHIVKYSRPFSFKNYEKMQRAGEGAKATAFVSITGITSAPAYVTRTAAQKLMYRYIIERIPDTTRTKEEFEKSEYKKTLKNKIRKGERVDFKEAVDYIGVKALRKLIKEAELPPFAELYKRLSLNEALNVYAIATDKEKREAKKILIDKFRRAYEDKKVTPYMLGMFRELLQK